MNTIDIRLRELGLNLPQSAKPVANYLPFVQTGNLVFIAGQLPLLEGKLLFTGHLGADVTDEQGNACARQCALNVLAQLHVACDGDLSRVKRLVKVTGFVACTPEFAGHPKIINGASDLFVAVFGEPGRHARAAVGVSALPMMAPVEIDAVAEID
jgi:enamine deaminase RidA (YjgF/YER057c/UK114 family)